MIGARVHRTRGGLAQCRAAGFTLLELIIVIAIIGLLATLILPNLKDPPRRAKEAVLKSNLRLLRESIDEYFAIEGQLPPSLQALIEANLLDAMPYDPFTRSTETWVEVLSTKAEPSPIAELDALGEPMEPAGPGVDDVRSGAEGNGLNGVPYAQW